MVDSSLINAVDEHERTAIYYACQGGNTKVIRRLCLQKIMNQAYYKSSIPSQLKF